MSYYRGDYYRGDYYRGDPGIFGFIGKAIGSVAKVGGALLTGGPTAAIGQAVRELTPGAPKLPAPSLNVSGNLPTIQGMTPGTSFQTAGGVTVGVSPLGTVGAVAPGRGRHYNKQGYWTRQGYVQKGTKLVTNRHTNVGNARALKRSLRRAHGFARLARHVMSFEITGRKHGRGHFKARRRR